MYPMKKALIIAFMLSCGIAFAQQNLVVSADAYLNEFTKTVDDKGNRDASILNKAKARIDSASKHPDVNNKPKTWNYRGKIYLMSFNHRCDVIKATVTETDVKKKITEVMAKVEMSDLDVALESFYKSNQLDAKAAYKPENDAGIKGCLMLFYEKAVTMYNKKEFGESSSYFEKSYILNEKYAGKKDTNSLENAEVAAGYAKQYERGITLANQLIGMGFKKEYYYEKNLDYYKLKGDKEGMSAWVLKGRVAYPNNIKFIIEELNTYIASGKSAQALDILELAIKNDPNNADLYRVKGQTYSTLAFPGGEKKPDGFDQNVKQAETALLKANELKPNNPMILYSIGAFYNNWGAFIFNQAQNEKELSKLAAGEKVAEGYFYKAIPFLEKEIEIDPQDRDALKALKQLYLKTGQAGSDKYKKVDDMLKN